MSGELFFQIDQFAIFAAVIISYLLCIFAGYWLGSAVRAQGKGRKTSLVITLQASAVGLLALILGFAFAMSSNRYEIRKQQIVEESNAIGSAYLLAGLLPVSDEKEVKQLMRQYADIRVNYFIEGPSLENLHKLEHEASALQTKMWNQIAEVSKNAPQAVTYLTVLKSFGDMFDARARRNMAMENHVPHIILMLLYAVSCLTLLLTAYAHGLERDRNLMPIIGLALLVALVIIVIIDMDRPRRGFVRLDTSDIVNLRNEMRQS